MEIYRIKNRKTGEYARKGTDDKKVWSKKGVAWTGLGYVKSHISQFSNWYHMFSNNRMVEYIDADIVSYGPAGETVIMPVAEYVLENLKQELKWTQENLESYLATGKNGKYYEEKHEKLIKLIDKIEKGSAV